jgi:hypothetical protein
MACYPSGQRDLTVNQTAQHSGVRIPHTPQSRNALKSKEAKQLKTLYI